LGGRISYEWTEIATGGEERNSRELLGKNSVPGGCSQITKGKKSLRSCKDPAPPAARKKRASLKTASDSSVQEEKGRVLRKLSKERNTVSQGKILRDGDSFHIKQASAHKGNGVNLGRNRERNLNQNRGLSLNIKET